MVTIHSDWSHTLVVIPLIQVIGNKHLSLKIPIEPVHSSGVSWATGPQTFGIHMSPWIRAGNGNCESRGKRVWTFTEEPAETEQKAWSSGCIREAPSYHPPDAERNLHYLLSLVSLWPAPSVPSQGSGWGGAGGDVISLYCCPCIPRDVGGMRKRSFKINMWQVKENSGSLITMWQIKENSVSWPVFPSG